MKTTRLVLEGASPDEMTERFLVSLMDLAEDHGLELAGVSVERRGESNG